MQVLVFYFSKTGRTRKLAEAAARGVESQGVRCVIKQASEVTKEDFVDSQGLIAGSPVYFGTMAAELKAVIDKRIDVRRKMEGKVGAAFATSAHPNGGKETTILSILQAMLIYGMIVVGDPIETGGHYGIACAGDPASGDEKEAEILGKRVALIVKKLFG